MHVVIVEYKPMIFIAYKILHLIYIKKGGGKTPPFDVNP